MSSPRTWGCFLNAASAWAQLLVFPTHVGVFPRAVPRAHFLAGLPHARGGVSSSSARIRAFALSSPRTWGCFSIRHCDIQFLQVFPTHVGVFPLSMPFFAKEARLPHARGGVSTPPVLMCSSVRSSPRTWGCFLDDAKPPNSAKVFPTHVGVFPYRSRQHHLQDSLPHARGGVSPCRT